MPNLPIMSVRTVVWLIAIGALSFIGALYFDTIESDAEFSHPAGSNSFSLAATGHMAFVETLRRLKTPVIISRYISSEKVGVADSLAVIEPNMSNEYKNIVGNLLNGENILLVLPKWIAKTDTAKRRWISDAKLRELGEIERFISSYIPDAALVRPSSIGSLKIGEDEFMPSILQPQLLLSDRVEAIVESRGGILFGRYQPKRGKQLWILSDPDILANHALGKGDNAAIAITLFNSTLKTGGKVIVDETAHGFQLEPNLWKLLFSKPYIIATIISLVSFSLIIWAALIRFGKALSGKEGLSPGKEILIDNTAALLELGGHGQETLEKYLEIAQRDVARAMHAPSNLVEKRLTDWLDRIAENRGVDLRLGKLIDQVSKAQNSGSGNRSVQIRTATRIHKWKTEMIYGSGLSS